MKIALAAHAWPAGSGALGVPEATGGTELHVRALARSLVERGHEVLAIVGSLEGAGGPGGPDAKGGVELVRSVDPHSGARLIEVRRPDLYFDHWHKSLSPAVTAAVRELLRAERPALLHLHHWLRLSRDLVLGAAREGVPAVVSLHDFFTSCPLVFRARPDTRAFCERATGAHPCVGCAARVPPRTPWVDQGQAFVLFAERQAALERELELARALVVPTESHRAALAGFLGRELAAEVVAPAHRPGWPAHVCEGVEALEPPSAGPARPRGLACWTGAAPHQGLGLLLEALERARQRSPVELHLLLAGSPPGPGRELPAHVRVLGPFEPAALFTHPVARAHAMVSASLGGESYGLVHDEALGLGLPAVLPAAGALAERAGQGVLLYPSGDVEGLAGALLELTDPARLESLRGEALAARAAPGALPTAGDVAERLLGIYAGAVAAGPPPAAELPAENWFEARMAGFALEQWDAALSARGAGELGLP